MIRTILRSVILAAALICVSAHAQEPAGAVPRSTVLSNITTSIPNNNQGLITPPIMRQLLTQIANSSVFYSQDLTGPTLLGNVNSGLGTIAAVPLNSTLQFDGSGKLGLGSQSANSVLGNATGSSAVPTALTTLPSGLAIPTPSITGQWTAFGANASPFTASGSWADFRTNGSISPNAIYRQISPSATEYDGLSSTITFPGGTTTDNNAAVAGYFRNQQGASGGSDNVVGLFSAGTCEVDNSACWGVNTLLQDSATRAAGSLTGIVLIGHEADFNVMNPGTSIDAGFSVGGNSLAQPTNANGFIVNGLGNGNQWTGAFISSDGASQVGLDIGALATGDTSAGQPNLLSWYDSSGVKQNVIIQATGGFLSVSNSPGSWTGLDISGGNLLLSAGQYLIINGNGILTADAAGDVSFGVSTKNVTINGAVVLGTLTTGTAATYACFTSGGTLISSGTAC